MKQQKKTFKEKLKNEMLKSGQFYVKLCFTILFAVIFVVIFVSNNGFNYCYATIYGNNFQRNPFQIHFIDVGRGDCILIKLPTNQTMLIDTGEEEYSLRVCEYITQYMIAEDMDKVDYFLITHPDTDHIGGALKIMQTFKVVNFLRPPVISISEYERGLYPEYGYDETYTYDNVINYAYQNQITMHFAIDGMSLNLGECKITCLSPTEEVKQSSNNYSVVLMIEYQNKKFLFMGDCENSIESRIVDKYGNNLNADLLKVGHHGSNTSTSQKLLDAVKPQYAVISTDGNSQYFPNAKVIERLNNANSQVLSTAKMGTILFTIEDNNIVFAKATRPPNYLAIIFACFLTIVLIVWENPFKNLNMPYFQKKIAK